jgi:hypothetical protein
MVAKRSIIENIPFDSDGVWNGFSNRDRGSLDVAFCYTCNQKRIKIMCDTDILLMHLRREGISMVGRKAPDWYFRPKGSTDVIKDWMRNKQILRQKLDKFMETGGLHNDAANQMMEAMANVLLGE